MRAFDPAAGAGNVNDRRTDDQRTPARPARRTQHGPIGFGQVFSMVRRKAGQHGHAAPAATAPHAAEPQARRQELEQRDHRGLHVDGSTLTALPASVQVDHQLHLLASGASELAGIDADASSLAAQNAKAALESQAPAAAKVTPERAMQLIADVARDMDNEHGARELHLELDPAHLGPIIVRLTVDKGRIRTELRTRDAAAAERLSAGSNDLRDRLAGLGFAHAEVDVRQDAGLFG